MIVYSFAVLSAILLAVTVIFDRYSLREYYKNDYRIPWLTSSVFGSIFGLVGTALTVLYLTKTSDVLINSFGAYIDVKLNLVALLTGVLVSLSIRQYFIAIKTAGAVVVSLSIAALPLVVFAGELLLENDNWKPWHFVSVGVSTAGFFLYHLFSNTESKEKVSKRIGLVDTGIFLAVSVVSLLSLDKVLYQAEVTTQLGAMSLVVVMPYYFLGISVGIIGLTNESVRQSLKKLLHIKKLVLIVVALEICGAAFYFFELLSIAKLDVTLVSLIVGCHVVVVWSYTYLLQKNKDQLKKAYFFEATGIALVLAGLVLWPN